MSMTPTPMTSRNHMISTDQLIEDLQLDLPPVKRLQHPVKRLLFWVALTLPVTLLLGATLEQQNLLVAFERVKDPRIAVELVAILLTALSAGYAALSCAQPGRSSKVCLLPIIPFVAWLSLVGEGCFRLYERIGPDQFSFAPLWTCYPAVAVTGFAPALVMVVMLRRGVLSMPTMTVFLATLAAAGLGAMGLRLYHAPDVTVMLLMWQLIATVTFMAVGSLVTRYIYRQPAI